MRLLIICLMVEALTCLASRFVVGCTIGLDLFYSSCESTEEEEETKSLRRSEERYYLDGANVRNDDNIGVRHNQRISTMPY